MDEAGGGIQLCQRGLSTWCTDMPCIVDCVPDHMVVVVSKARGIYTRGCTKTIVSGKGGSHSWISHSIAGLSSYIMQCVLPFAITIPIKTHHTYYSHSISFQSVIIGGNKPF